MVRKLLRKLLSGNWHCWLCQGEWTDRGCGMWMAFWKHKDWCPLKTHRVLSDGSRVYEGATMHRYWISWIQPGDDYRPLTFPPNEQILGWWCSGYDADDNATLCAVVSAANDEDAQDAVRTDWPEAEQWRFISQREEGFMPGDRFVLEPWMKERLGV